MWHELGEWSENMHEIQLRPALNIVKHAAAPSLLQGGDDGEGPLKSMVYF